MAAPTALLNNEVIKIIQDITSLLKEFGLDNLTEEQKEKIRILDASNKKLSVFINKVIKSLNVDIHQASFESPNNKKLSAFVLLVEDEPIVQRVHRLMLEQLGYKVDLAETGQQAIDKSFQKPDVILMDLGLPDIDGIEVTKKIRAFKDAPEIANVPIIILTAYKDEETRERCLNLGVNAFSLKPISPLTLLQVIENVININKVG